MTISSEIDRNSYTGNGAVDTYDYTFRIITQNDLLVVVKQTSSGTETTLTISTDYTVTGVGNDGGGTVVLVNASQAWLDGDGDLATGYTITIRRKVTVTQETDIRNQGDFFPETHEDAFDYSRMIDQQQQDEIDRSVKNPEGVLTSAFNPELPDDIATANVAIITNPSGNGWIVGPTASEISGANASAVAAAASAVLASQWASKTDGIVDSSDYSSKAWSIGGTNVTETASRGAAKEWATKTDNPVDTSEFSSKEYAQGTQASTGGSAKNWATQLGSDVTGASAGDMSSREWAVGTLGRGVASEGSSKDWATYTGGSVDDTEYASKAWAVGGTGVSDTASRGASKEWAVETSGTVDGTNYSSKEHAVGTQTRGVSGGGSAKDWATYTSSTVDDTDYSAKYYAQQAAAAINSAFFRDVVYITNSDSPVTIAEADNGKLYSIDSSGGAITINLPEISGLSSLPYNIAFSLGTAGNTVTINRGGSSDTIEGSTSTTLTAAGTGKQLAADTDGTPDNWTSLEFGTVADGAISTVKLADDSVTRAKIATGGIGNLSVTTKTAAYTITNSDDVILGDTSSAAFTLTLPSASTVGSGRVYIIKYIDSGTANSLTVDGDGSETIDGDTSVLLDVEGESLSVVSDGTNWRISDHYVPEIQVTGASNGGTSITANTTNIDFTEVSDTHGTWNGTQFTAPKSGVYHIEGFVNWSSPNSGAFYTYLDASSEKVSGFNGANASTRAFSWTGSLNKSQVWSLRSDTSITLTASTSLHWIKIANR